MAYSYTTQLNSELQFSEKVEVLRMVDRNFGEFAATH